MHGSPACEATTTFEIILGHMHSPRILARVELVTTALVEEELTEADAVDESCVCQFQVTYPEPDLSYRIFVGDLELRDEETGQILEPEPDFQPGIVMFKWRGRHLRPFDGAWGRVWLRLLSRKSETREKWQLRCLIGVRVVSSKLTGQRYSSMCEEMARLAGGLLHDLISKYAFSADIDRNWQTVTTRSSQMELKYIGLIWNMMSLHLQEIALQPTAALTRTPQILPTWGCERLGERTLVRLAMTGADPRRSAIAAPFPAYRDRVCETLDTVEHRAIKGFLLFLIESIGDCLANLETEYQAIRDEYRRFRIRHTNQGQPSLYEIEDQPRIEALECDRERGEQLEQSIWHVLNHEPFRDVKSDLDFPFINTPVFENVASYRKIHEIMHTYFLSSLVSLNRGWEERMKSLDKIYEQWAFVQLASAMKCVGLECFSREGLIQRVRRFRYTLNIDRGAQISFRAADGCVLTLQYENYIQPYREAVQHGEELCRSGDGESWCPDILIRLYRPGVAGPELEEVIVIDAKYCRRVTDHHWHDVEKYHRIRTTKHKTQIAKLLWIVYPGTDSPSIEMIDQDLVAWTPSGPDCCRSEVVKGEIRLVPSESAPSETEDGWLATPSPTMLEFVTGMLRFYGVQLTEKMA